MKKSTFLISILLVIAILLTACGKDSSIICGNCAASVPGDSFYCPNCGTAFFQSSTGETTVETTGGTVNVENNTATPENKPVTPDNAPVQTPHETTHVHSFSAATCLVPQTCACGATCGGLGEHDYEDHICSLCGDVESGYAYEHLCAWLLTEGTRQNDLYRVDVIEDDMMYSLVYDTTNDCAYMSVSFKSEGDFFFSCVWLDDYHFGTTFANASLEGTLNPHAFTAHSTIPVSRFTGEKDDQDAYVSATQSSVCDMLSWLEVYLYYNGTGITIADLGFTAY